jgi:hypothetical protein
MSATTVQNVKKTFTASGTIAQYSLVKIETDGKVSTATKVGSGEVRVGFSDRAAADGEATSVTLLNGGGSAFGIASATVTIGDILFGATTGKLGTTASHTSVGVALNTVGADDVLEVLVHNPAS